MKNEVREEDVLSLEFCFPHHRAFIQLELGQPQYLKSCIRVLSRSSNAEVLRQYSVKVCKQ